MKRQLIVKLHHQQEKHWQEVFDILTRCTADVIIDLLLTENALTSYWC